MWTLIECFHSHAANFFPFNDTPRFYNVSNMSQRKAAQLYIWEIEEFIKFHINLQTIRDFSSPLVLSSHHIAINFPAQDIKIFPTINHIYYECEVVFNHFFSLDGMRQSLIGADRYLILILIASWWIESHEKKRREFVSVRGEDRAQSGKVWSED